MKRLAVFATHPIQYQAPLWRSLARDPALDVHVYFGSDFSVRGYRDEGFGVDLAWDVPLTEGYAHSYLSTDAAVQDPRQLRFRPREFTRRLGSCPPDCALLNAYTPFGFYLPALLALRRLGARVLLRAEASDESSKPGRVRRIGRALCLSLLYSQIDAFLAIGEIARRHYRARGVPPARIGWSPYCIDTDLFERQVQTWLPQRAEVRRSLGFAERDNVFLFSGKLMPLKNPLTLAAALRLLAEQGARDIGLLVVGDGALREPLENAARAIPGLKAVFAGFQNQTALGRFYAAADCVVLPSHSETWGLVVNEALQFGLPAIVSDRVGCRHDLVVPDETGYVFPAGDGRALAERMRSTIELLATRRDAVRDACRRRVASYSVEHAAAGIRTAVLGATPTATGIPA